MTHQEEQFLHFVQSIQNLNNAWVILQVIERFSDERDPATRMNRLFQKVCLVFRSMVDYIRLKNAPKDYKGSPHLINAAFQFAIIEYCKPYTKSHGTVQRNYRLDETHIPAEHLELHARLRQDRNHIHAHSDLTVLDAKVYVRNTPYGNIAGHIQNTIHGTEEMRNLDAIIDLIEQTLNSMYEEEKRLEQQLPANA